MNIEIGKVYQNVGDKPGVRNWGRVRVDALTDGRVEMTLIEANDGAGCPGSAPVEVFEKHFVAAA